MGSNNNPKRLTDDQKKHIMQMRKRLDDTQTELNQAVQKQHPIDTTTMLAAIEQRMRESKDEEHTLAMACYVGVVNTMLQEIDLGLLNGKLK